MIRRISIFKDVGFEGVKDENECSCPSIPRTVKRED